MLAPGCAFVSHLWHQDCLFRIEYLAKNARYVNAPLRILHLEDDPDFSDLVRTLLATEGVCAEVRTVSSRSEYELALKEQFDVILADYFLPGYTGIEALQF